MAKTSTYVLCLVLFWIGTCVLGDERFEKKYFQVLEDMSAIAAEWNVTDLPGYECSVNREQGIPALGEERVFPCEYVEPSANIPTSVHHLRPADVKVVGAMGDSISAANGGGSCWLPELINEYRGRMFSHGGDETFERNPTLANTLRKFNPNLKGYGTDIGRWDSKEAGMNVGYPGDKANDMPHQAEWLIQKMKADTSIDFENDWKVVTIFIGGNDLCAWCKNTEYYSPDNYVKFISEGLMILHDGMPRTLVNVVGILEIWQLDLMRSPKCNIFHWLACECAMFLTADELERYAAINTEYQDKMEADILSGRYDDKNDFTVVLQPFFHKTPAPFTEEGEPDFSYFAPDCFHFSAKGHDQVGLDLWKNMLEPVGAKSTSWSPEEKTINCPTEENPYIFTNVNSRPEFWDPTTPASGTGRKIASNYQLVLLLSVIVASLILH